MTVHLENFPEGYRAAVWGASGGIGRAFVEGLASDPRCASVAAFSRRDEPSGGKVARFAYDPHSDSSISDAAGRAADGKRWDVVLVATGTLHDDGYGPEKALRQLEPEAFLAVMRINALLPALIAKTSVPHLCRGRAVFAALSARVGSLSDNRLGGWHSYRSSKAALNMLLRNIAIEVARKNDQAVIVGLHPGTVDTDLSAPFQANVPDGKLFSPQQSASMMLQVVDNLQPDQSGQCFDYAGKGVPF